MRAVIHHLHADKQSEPSHVADEREASHEVGETFDQVIPNVQRVRLQTFGLHHVEHGESDRAGDRVPAKGAEELHAVGERRGDVRCGHHRGHRVPIPDGLSHRYDVGDNALRLEGPEVRAYTSEANLHFVSDADASSVPHMTIGLGQVAVGQDDLSAAAQDRLGEKGTWTPAGTHHIAHRVAHPLRILPSRLRVVLSEGTAIGVGHGDLVYPGRRARSPRAVEFVGAHVDQG